MLNESAVGEIGIFWPTSHGISDVVQDRTNFATDH